MKKRTTIRVKPGATKTRKGRRDRRNKKNEGTEMRTRRGSRQQPSRRGGLEKESNANDGESNQMVEVEENEYMLPTSGFLPLAGRLVNWLWFPKKTGSGGSRVQAKRGRGEGIRDPRHLSCSARALKSTHLGGTHSLAPWSRNPCRESSSRTNQLKSRRDVPWQAWVRARVLCICSLPYGE